MGYSSHDKALHDNADGQVVAMVIGLSLTANCTICRSLNGTRTCSFYQLTKCLKCFSYGLGTRKRILSHIP